MALYLIPNGPSPTTAAQALVQTGTAIMTHLQVHMGDSYASNPKIVEWGVSFDGDPTEVAAAGNIACELVTTNTVACTGMTAHVAAGINKIKDSEPTPADNFPFAFGVGETAFSDGTVTEGTILETSHKDFQFVSPAGLYVKQFPLGREPDFLAEDFLRVRITSPIDVGCYAYVVIEV